YRRLKRLPNVVAVSPKESSLSLIQRAALTCVITGTAALEAVLLGKPAIVMGAVPFTVLGEGIMHCPNLQELPDAVAAALKMPPADDERLALYIASILATSFELAATMFGDEEGERTIAGTPENVHNICEGLLDICRKQPC
ncbi:MAG: hypothetical protein V2B18_25165, partial [Pseudomonadota bacterium]